MPRFASDSEVLGLLIDLRLGAPPDRVKQALQRLSDFCLAGNRIKEPDRIRQLVHSHLSGPNLDLRRWSMKALGLMRNRDDFMRIQNQSKLEDDPQARAWAMAAMLSITKEHTVDEIRARSGLESDKSLDLAAMLYSNQEWMKKNAKPVVVRLTDDSWVLEWALFLIGYDKAPPNLFDPRHENDVFIRELNNHVKPEICEYAAWAVYERPDFNFRTLGVQLHNFDYNPPGVRKWLYRAAMQSHEMIDLTEDHLAAFTRDSVVSARDGAARGVADLIGDQFDRVLLDWYEQEKEDRIKKTLLESFAKRPSENPLFSELVTDRFSAADEAFRARLLIATQGGRIYTLLQKRLSEERREKRTQLPLQTTIFTELMEINMGDDNRAINVKGDINAQAVAVEGAEGRADRFTQCIQNLSNSDAKTLKAIRDEIQKLELAEADRNELITAVDDTAADPTPESKEKLLSTLDKVKNATESISRTAKNLSELKSLAASLLGLA